MYIYLNFTFILAKACSRLGKSLKIEKYNPVTLSPFDIKVFLSGTGENCHFCSSEWKKNVVSLKKNKKM